MRIRMYAAVWTALVVLAAQAAFAAGSISGRILNKDGVPVANAVVRVVPQGATADVEGKKAVAVNVRTDPRGLFTLSGVPAGKMNVVVTWVAPDGSPQRGQLVQAVEVVDGTELKLPDDLRMEDAPVRLPAASAISQPAATGLGRGRGRSGGN